MRYSWSFEEVDAKLKDIMVNIFRNVRAVAKEYGQEDNLVWVQILQDPESCKCYDGTGSVSCKRKNKIENTGVGGHFSDSFFFCVFFWHILFYFYIFFIFLLIFVLHYMLNLI